MLELVYSDLAKSVAEEIHGFATAQGRSISDNLIYSNILPQLHHLVKWGANVEELSKVLQRRPNETIEDRMALLKSVLRRLPRFFEHIPVILSAAARRPELTFDIILAAQSFKYGEDVFKSTLELSDKVDNPSYILRSVGFHSYALGDGDKSEFNEVSVTPERMRRAISNAISYPQHAETLILYANLDTDELLRYDLLLEQLKRTKHHIAKRLKSPFTDAFYLFNLPDVLQEDPIDALKTLNFVLEKNSGYTAWFKSNPKIKEVQENLNELGFSIQDGTTLFTRNISPIKNYEQLSPTDYFKYMVIGLLGSEDPIESTKAEEIFDRDVLKCARDYLFSTGARPHEILMLYESSLNDTRNREGLLTYLEGFIKRANNRDVKVERTADLLLGMKGILRGVDTVKFALARLWTRDIEDLFDSEILSSCAFLPYSTRSLHYLLDPAIKMVDIVPNNTYPIGRHILVATQDSNNKPYWLLDSFEGGPVLDSALGRGRALRFAYEALMEFVKRSEVDLVVNVNVGGAKAKSFKRMIQRYTGENPRELYLRKVGGNYLLREFSSKKPQFFLEAFKEDDRYSGTVQAITLKF